MLFKFDFLQFLEFSTLESPRVRQPCLCLTISRARARVTGTKKTENLFRLFVTAVSTLLHHWSTMYEKCYKVESYKIVVASYKL